MTLGERIKARREEIGISQADFAKAIGVSSAMLISNWEKSKGKPTADTMYNICQVLNCPLEYFLEEENTSSHNLSEIEINLIQKFRMIDDMGQDVVLNALDHQYKRCQVNGIDIISNNMEDNQSYTLTAAPVTEVLFVTKNDSNYLEMKDKLAELRRMKKKSFMTVDMISSFLHFSGYNYKITIADLVMLFNGLKVPSQRLYQDIKKILQISIDMYKN